MDKFDILSDYRLLVRRGLAEEIVCRRDATPYVVRLNDGITPRLHCYACGSDYYPSDREYAEWQDMVTK